MRDLWLLHERSLDTKEILYKHTGKYYQKYQKRFRICPPIQGKIPKTVLSIWEESGDVKCHVATKGSIFDFVGDRVHG